jgi:predicted ATP-grasp superfamily ATP-dependent carboligase
VISSRKTFDQWMTDFRTRGLDIDQLCYQELLSIRDKDNVSICGWYDQRKHYLFCTRKVLQHPPKTGNGDVVERIEPPDGLMDVAIRILQALKYDGPLELEFVFDERSNSYQVIELNPRFWMQHGLIEAVTGHALVSSYLGIAPTKPSVPMPEDHYWVNPLYAVFRLMKTDIRAVRYALRRDAYMPFSFSQAIGYAPIHIFHKVLHKC